MASQAVKEAARSMAGSVKKMFRKASEMLHLGVVTNLLSLFVSETGRMHAQGSSTTEDIETGRLPADHSRGETARDDAEATKQALKVAHVTIAAASSGILTIIIGVLAIEQLRHAYSLHMKICVLFLVASFVSGACLILLAGSRHMRIVTTLVITTLGALVLAVVYAVIAFLTLVD